MVVITCPQHESSTNFEASSQHFKTLKFYIYFSTHNAAV